MNNGILAPKSFSAGTDLVGIKPLLGVPQTVPTPYHLPKSNDYMIGNSDGTSSEDYILVIDTSKGTSTTVSLTISAQAGGSLSIDWGDGTNGALIPGGTANVSRPGSYETKLQFTGASSFGASHTYSMHGIYRIIVKGILGSSTNATAPIIIPASTLISVESFGKEVNRIGLISYNGATNLTYVPPYLPTTVTSLAATFAGCPNLNQKEIARWGVSSVTNMFQTFNGVTKFPIEGDWNWNTRNANMFQMFINAQNINNINFSGWIFNGGMNEMFRNATINNCSFINWSGSDSRFSFRESRLNNCTLSGWRITSQASPMFSAGVSLFANVSNLYMPDWDLRGVTNLSYMFYGVNGTKSGLDDWNVSGVTNMSNMFERGSDFMTADLSNWDISKVTNFTNFMIRGLGVPTPSGAIRIDNWNIASGATCEGMFGDPANKLVSLSGWKFLGNNNCSRMFGVFNYGAFALNYFNMDLTTWDTSGISNMNSMFDRGGWLTFIGTGVNGDLRNWNTSNVTDMGSMFNWCINFNSSVSGWDTSKVQSMSNMFQGCASFAGSGLETWNTSNVTNMNSMFYLAGANNGSMNANLSGWNTGKVTNMANMFGSNYNILQRFAGSGIDNWNVTGVTTINGMFYLNTNVNSALRCNLSGWNLCNCTDMTNFMRSCNIGSGNYDILLNSWEATSTGNPVKPWATGINVHFGTSKYTAASSGARQRLINYGWTITDGGFQA